MGAPSAEGESCSKKRWINTYIFFLHIYILHTFLYSQGQIVYSLCIFTLQCCAQAPLIRQRSTSSQTPLLVGVGFAYIGPLGTQTPKSLFCCCFSVRGVKSTERPHPPRHPPARSPNPKAVTHILQGGWCKNLQVVKMKRVGKKSSFS